MLDALPLPLPLLLGGLGVVALLVGVVLVWTRGRGSGKKAFVEFASDPSPQQVAQAKGSATRAAVAASEETQPEPLPPSPQEPAKPMVVANFAPDQLSLGRTVPAGRRRPGTSMRSFKEMAGSVVTKG